MVVALTIEKMIQFYHGNIHDVSHFLKVYAFAKTIGELERLTPQTQETLELAAVVHDIACPLCREKYGNTNGKKQELESPPLIENFFAALSVSQETVQRITWLVAHHHTYGLSEDLDYQILLEADYIVNAGESGLPAKSVRSALQKIFKTKTGSELLSSLYLHNSRSLSFMENAQMKI